LIFIFFKIIYYNQGNVEVFKHILNEIISESIKEKYNDYRDDRIQAYNILAAYYLQLSQIKDNEQEKNECYNQISQLLANANLEDQAQPITFTTRGIMYLQQQKYDRALTQFSTALASDERNLHALLGKACVLFHQKLYTSALKCYSDALTSHPDCSSDVRFGLLKFFKKRNWFVLLQIG
jgi:RNA polymerase-associated protein CTR9